MPKRAGWDKDESHEVTARSAPVRRALCTWFLAAACEHRLDNDELLADCARSPPWLRISICFVVHVRVIIGPSLMQPRMSSPASRAQGWPGRSPKAQWSLPVGMLRSQSASLRDDYARQHPSVSYSSLIKKVWWAVLIGALGNSRLGLGNACSLHDAGARERCSSLKMPLISSRDDRHCPGRSG